jgi:hypothetical protein
MILDPNRKRTGIPRAKSEAIDRIAARTAIARIFRSIAR